MTREKIQLPLDPRQHVAVALLALLLLSPLRASAESSIEKQLKYDYLDKVLTLRHFYSGRHLRFHSDGTLQGAAKVGPWTLDGQIEVEDIHLRGAQLHIKGRRIHSIFDAQQNPKDQLRALGNNLDNEQKELEKELRNLKVEIEIDLPNETPEEKDVSSAIHAVFLSTSESMVDIVPSYWRAYFAKQEGKPVPPSKGPLSPIKRGETSPPRALYSPEPEYSHEARKAKSIGTVVLSLVVDTSGAPRDLQVVRPFGLGLDENAIAAVSTWKFEPAQRAGAAVAVSLNIEVTYHLY